MSSIHEDMLMMFLFRGGDGNWHFSAIYFFFEFLLSKVVEKLVYTWQCEEINFSVTGLSCHFYIFWTKVFVQRVSNHVFVGWVKAIEYNKEWVLARFSWILKSKSDLPVQSRWLLAQHALCSSLRTISPLMPIVSRAPLVPSRVWRI